MGASVVYGDHLIENQGREIDYVVATDEVSIRQQGQAERVHKFTTKAEDEDAAIARARAQGKAAGGSMDLVLYPKGHEGNADLRRIVRSRILVELREGADGQALAARFGLTTKEVKGNSSLLILNTEDSAKALELLAQIRKDKAVASANPLLARQANKRATPTDPRFKWTESNTSYQWHLWNTGQNGGVEGVDVNILNVWDNYTGRDVNISIVDDGLQVGHPDLQENARTDIDANWNDGNPLDPTPRAVDQDHGTAVAGVAAANWNNSTGGTGSAPLAGLVGLRLIAEPADDMQESEALAWLAGAIDPADQVFVSNNSWGPPDNAEYADAGPLVKDAFELGATVGRGGKGIIYMWAGGNGLAQEDNSNYDGYANSIYTVAVGAVTDRGRQSWYSEPGANLVVCAPSNGGNQGITTTSPFSTYVDDFGGTSSATPLASGVVALILEANPNLGWRDVQEILITSAREIDPTDGDWRDNDAGFHFNHKYGAGMINAEAAVALAQTWTNLEPQTSETITKVNIDQEISEGAGNPLVQYFDFSLLDNKRVEHVQVRVDATHARPKDLEITLVSPGGTKSVLSEVSLNDGFMEDIPNWTYMTVRNWGENSKGVWTLEIRDLRTGQFGDLLEAEVTVYGVDNPDAEINFPPVITSDSHVSGPVDEFMSYFLSTTSEGDTVVLNSALPPGMSYDADTTSIAGFPTEIGIYQVLFDVSNNTNTFGFVLTMAVGGTPEYTLAGAIEQEGESVTTGGDSVWLDQFFDTYDGSDAVTSPPDLFDSGFSDLVFNAKTGGIVMFDWKVSSQEGADRLWFYPEGTGFQDWAGFISGEMSWGTFATKIPDTGSSLTWTYRKDAANSMGSDTGSVDRVRIIPVEDYATMLTDYSASSFDFDTNSKALWLPLESIASPDGMLLKTSAIGNGQNCELRTVIQGPGLVKFSWMVSSDDDDELQFLVDGALIQGISGERPWRDRSFFIGAGPRELKWRYLKNDNTSGGSLDAGFLDSMSFVVADDYESWSEGFFSEAQLADPAISGLNADPNGNGIVNLLEYAFGGNPLVDDGSLTLPTFEQGDGSSVFTYTANGLNADLEYILETSSDLVNWTPVDGVFVDRVEGVSTYTYTMTPGVDGTEQFIRVKVNQLQSEE